MDGFINLYKPKDFTSHDALNIIRRNFRGIKIGHGGTLDPDATGVLPVCLGKATKLQELVMGQTKSYETDVIFGLTSLSLDLSGEYTVTDADFVLDEAKLKTVLQQFRGEQLQRPPAVSAIKQNGVPLYKLAKKGLPAEAELRRVVITEITLKGVYADETYPRIRIGVKCSKGTYIRSLGRDIGIAMGTTAVIDQLVRLASGKFLLENAYTLAEIDAFCAKKDYSFIMPMELAVKDLPVYELKDGAEWKAMLDGNALFTPELENGNVAVYDMSHTLMAVAAVADGVLKPKKMLWEKRKRQKPLMEFNGFEQYDHIDATAVVIGNFDGVHLGHRYLIDHCVKAAEAKGLPSLVLSFYPHPKIFFGAEDHWYLRTQAEKRKIIDSLGADRMLTVDFNAQFAAISEEEFVTEILSRRLHACLIYVGEDFTFGKNGAGSAATLKQLCAVYAIEVQILPKVAYQSEPISSSKIKMFLANGDVINAAKLLGSAYELSGVVAHGNELGRNLSFPTANLNFPAELFIPKAGVYIAYARYDGKKHEAVANVGKRPTVGVGLATNLEVYILDDTPDLYGKSLTVTMITLIREEQKFASLEDLRSAISHDVEETKIFFEKRRSNPCNLS